MSADSPQSDSLAASLQPPMLCHLLAARICELDPGLSPTEVARLCLLLLNSTAEPETLADLGALRQQCKAAAFRLKAAADQHAAMTEELDSLCGDDPQRFTPDQIWTLVRALKVQSQTLELYTHQPAFI